LSICPPKSLYLVREDLVKELIRGTSYALLCKSKALCYNIWIVKEALPLCNISAVPHKLKSSLYSLFFAVL